jgi:hypothetical protein
MGWLPLWRAGVSIIWGVENRIFERWKGEGISRFLALDEE